MLHSNDEISFNDTRHHIGFADFFTGVYLPMKADNTATSNRKARRQTDWDLLQLRLWKDNPTEIITNSSKNSTRAT